MQRGDPREVPTRSLLQATEIVFEQGQMKALRSCGDGLGVILASRNPFLSGSSRKAQGQSQRSRGSLAKIWKHRA